jgi:hypothetical protein
MVQFIFGDLLEETLIVRISNRLGKFMINPVFGDFVLLSC